MREVTAKADSGIYMLDTNIISDLMQGANSIAAQRARQAIAQGRVKQLCCSVVVECELLFGLTKRPSARLQAAYNLEMEKLEILVLTSSVAAHYAKIRAYLEALGTPIGANDTLIAAHALAVDATLVSADAEFMRVPGLKVENWLAAEKTPN